MAECLHSNESGSSRSVYPALAVAALAGLALTYFLVKKTKESDGQLPVDKVVNLCNSAVDKLEAYVSQSLAS